MGRWGKAPYSKMLRHLFLEMFGLCLTAPLCSEKENWKNREEKRGEVRYKREGATKKDRLTAAVHVDLQRGEDANDAFQRIVQLAELGEGKILRLRLNLAGDGRADGSELLHAGG